MRSARSRFSDDEESGQDSFLDIVANIVGILILLVMVVGVRAARRPATASVEQVVEQAAEQATESVSAPLAAEDPAVRVAAEIEEQTREAAQRAYESERDAKKLYARAAQAKQEIALQDGVRVQLATFAQSLEEEIAEKRRELAEDERRDYDQRIAIATAERRLEELTRQQAAQLAVESQVETLENLPTPIAKTVHEDEVFLMLSKGEVTVIPLDALRQQLYSQLERQISQLARRDSISFVVGPVGGFRMRFVADKVRVPTSNGFRVTARPRWELVPSENLIFEPVDRAINDGSALMTELAAYPPRRSTVTVVTYSDSFNEFRTLKQALYRRGYPVAGRPLKVGQPVVGSPSGTRSAAQ